MLIKQLEKAGIIAGRSVKIKTPFFDAGDEIAFPLNVFLLFALFFFLLSQG